jgi:hypothetical protein
MDLLEMSYMVLSLHARFFCSSSDLLCTHYVLKVKGFVGLVTYIPILGAINGETNTIRGLYHKDLYQQKWPKTTFIGRGSQGNHSGHKRIFIKELICEKIHANTLQLPYWFHRWCH